MSLVDAVGIAVEALQSHAHLPDDQVIQALVERGIAAAQAVRLVQFVPIAFCRFVYRSSGIQFDENYVVVGPDGQPKGKSPLGNEPIFREATANCEIALATGEREQYFMPVAARSGGFQAITQLLQKGSTPENIRTGPPLIRE
jgi:hypothetical protein